jgi:hypothetical protein
MGDAWYLNPFKWADKSDLYDLSGKLTEDRAIDVLEDILVHRPTDQTTMVRGVKNSVRVAKLTDRQTTAIDLAREAMMNGKRAHQVTGYVAQHLGIHRTNAYQLLKRADSKIQPKIATFREKVAVYHNTISKADIDRELNRMKSICAGCGKMNAPARTCICHACLMEYGMEGERPPETVKWLDPEQLRLRRLARNEAKNRLMTVDGVLELGA